MTTRPRVFPPLWRKLIGRCGVLLRNGLLTLHARVKGRGAERVSAVKNARGMTVLIVGDAETYAPGGRKDTFKALFNGARLCNRADGGRTSCAVLHYLRDSSIMKKQIAALFHSLTGTRPLYFVETGFASGILGVTRDGGIPAEYRRVHSYLIDDMGFYFDSTAGSRMERHINAEDFSLPPGEKKRCAALIRAIVENRITKYNFQPLELPDSMKREGKKALVVDQAFADASVQRGGGSAASFERMLADALEENPEATVFVKSHPDAHLRNGRCYYGGLAASARENARIVMVTVPVNPYALLEGVDAVYTCTSQLGFEALMAGKRVKTYGMPIYAGWGLTEDRLSCPRRTRRRSVEEVFHALYVAFAVHIDPFTLKRCSLERYLESLLALRATYFASASGMGGGA
jgi:capsular polysaccharide export protein